MATSNGEFLEHLSDGAEGACSPGTNLRGTHFQGSGSLQCHRYLRCSQETIRRFKWHARPIINYVEAVTNLNSYLFSLSSLLS